MPPTTIIEMRGDLKVLVTILRFAKSKGVDIKSKSELIKWGLDLLAQIIGDSSPHLIPSSYEEAHLDFFQHFQTSPIRRGRDTGQLAKKMIEERGGDIFHSHFSQDSIPNFPTPEDDEAEDIIRRRTLELEKLLGK